MKLTMTNLRRWLYGTPRPRVTIGLAPLLHPYSVDTNPRIPAEVWDHCGHCPGDCSYLHTVPCDPCQTDVGILSCGCVPPCEGHERDES